ncbi:putative lipoprotein [Gordonia araii NBRC 100433]|uniref:Putative lipoprotein n=1 Tax=Gordonia araii NBRC 100433 TaxID=1073574 RepID=G7H1V7_9ACTN|nr:hypothetical protein [Gordonia araii]NNG97166.1 Mesocentin [Gordonia araii NBRC 100433]GAB09832.1 putative lipoprotein [Gordonia araii NBRC 100433]
MKRFLGVFSALAALVLIVGGCSSDGDDTAESSKAPPGSAAVTGDPSKPDPRTAGWDIDGYPINGGPKGADGSTGNNLDRHYCAHNQDPRCPVGSYVGQFTPYHDKHGYWNTQGKPVNGGPVGADGSTGNNLTQEYCARNQNPACPKGSYVGPNAQRDPKGGPHYVKCEGTICTNPNHGAGTNPRENGGDRSATGVWDANGRPIAGGPTGADGSTNNNLTRQYCASNQDPACPAGSYIHPQQRQAPPAPAPEPQAPPEPGQTEFRGPDSPPEPGQPDMQGPQGDQNDGNQGDGNQGGDDQGPPEPGQDSEQGDGDGDN